MFSEIKKRRFQCGILLVTAWSFFHAVLWIANPQAIDDTNINNDIYSKPSLLFDLTNVSQTKSNRKIILHVGPAKTATTTLQSDLYSLTDTLEKDNYLYMGRKSNHRWLQDLLLTCPSMIESDPHCVDRILEFFSNITSNSTNTKNSFHLHHDYNVILSEEFYCNALWDDSAKTVVRTRILPHLSRDLVVVATYRRFHDWLVSARKQRDAQMKERKLWPWDGGSRSDAWKETILLRARDQKPGKPHYLPDCLQQWDDLNVSVSILNLHDEIPLTELFLCQFLPDTKNTCAVYQERNSSERFANARSGMEYFFDNIVFDAAEVGLFNITNTPFQRRRQVTKQLMHYFHNELNKTVAVLPMECPSKADLEDLFEESMFWEQQYATDMYNNEAFQASFQQHIESKNFCRVDTKNLFHGLSNWTQVLERLKLLD